MLPPVVQHICEAAEQSAGVTLNGAAFGPLKSHFFGVCGGGGCLSPDLYSSGLNPSHEHGVEV